MYWEKYEKKLGRRRDECSTRHDVFPSSSRYIGEQSYCRLDIDFDDVGCIQSHVPAHAVYTSNIRGVK